MFKYVLVFKYSTNDPCSYIQHGRDLKKKKCLRTADAGGSPWEMGAHEASASRQEQSKSVVSMYDIESTPISKYESETSRSSPLWFTSTQLHDATS
jgi:hypothetical protein